MYNSVPILELKRQARAKNHRAEALYKAANYGASLDALLWIIGTAVGITLFIWSARTGPWLAGAVMLASAWLIIWMPAPRWNGWVGSAAALTAKPLGRLLSFLNPVLSRISDLVPPASRAHVHTGLYEKNDLLEFLTKQNKQLDNRIPESDLSIAYGAMSFGDKLVSSVMTPRRKIKLVGAGDSVGPLLMDELHKSGHSRFPVVKDSAKGANPEIVGTLYLKDIIGHDGSGKVKDLARKDVYFINEESTLRQALSAFLKTHHHLLVVVNNFEEIVGVFSIEDVLEQIIGHPIVDEFDSYDDLRAVATKEAKQEHIEQDHQEVVPPDPATS
ncbi:CBS domain-containing protein [Candidatus Saccharibacteria bacterium]|nr:CBS domain-containing protein [Candidatus Saccharibacteria bacterium]